MCHDVDRPELCQLTDPTIEIVSTSPSVLPLGMWTKRSSFVFKRNKYFPLGENMTKTKYFYICDKYKIVQYFLDKLVPMITKCKKITLFKAGHCHILQTANWFKNFLILRQNITHYGSTLTPGLLTRRILPRLPPHPPPLPERKRIPK